MLFHTAGTIALPKYFGLDVFEKLFRFGGSAGVEFFFVLSGFIIVNAHQCDFDQPGRLKAYVLRRLFRIYPTYWLVFALIIAVSLVTHIGRDGMPSGAGVWLQSLLLWPQDPAVVGGTGAPVVVVAWSLQYEMIFYAAIALCIAGTRWAAAGASLVAALYALCHAAGMAWPLAFLSVPMLLLFVLGGCAAWINRRLRLAQPMRWVAFWAALWAVYVATQVAAAWAGPAAPVPSPYTLGHGLVCAGLIVALVQAEGRGALRPPSITDMAGGASYGLYLIHFPIVSLGCKLVLSIGLSGLVGGVVAMLVVGIASVGSALVLHLLFEKPALRWLHARFLVPAHPNRRVSP